MKDNLIEKLYADQIELTSEEVAYLARLVHNAEGEHVPYNHEERDVYKAVGFESKDHAVKIARLSNKLFKEEVKGAKHTSRKVEEAEKLILADPLNVRLFVLGFIKMMRKTKAHGIDS